MVGSNREGTAVGAVGASFDASPVPTLVHHPETGAILDANDASADLLGRDVETLRGDGLAVFLASADDREARADRLLETARADGEHAFDGTLVRPDGSNARIHVELRRAAVGGADRVLAFVTDVAESRSQTRIIQRLHGVATDLMDAASRPEVADITTEAAERVIDYSIATVRLATEDDRLELVSMTADTEAIFSDDLPIYEVGEGFIGRAYASGEPTIVDDLAELETAIDHDPVQSAVCVPLGDHGVVTIGGKHAGQFDASDVEFVRLLTRLTEAALDQIERERALQDRTDKLETLLNNAPLIFYALDTEGTIVESRGRGLERLGLAPGEAVGNSIFEMYSHAPEVRELAERALEGESTSDALEVGGQWFDNTFVPVFDEDGDLDQVVGIAVDVTEQKAVEEQFAALSESAIELSDSDSARAAIEQALDIASAVLGDFVVAYWELDAEESRLELSALSDAAGTLTAGDESDLVHAEGDPIWRIYERGETVLDNDFDPAKTANAAPLRSMILAPVSGYGLLTVGTVEPGAFGDRDRHLVAILVGLLRTTLNRLGYERELEASRRELRRSNESLQQFAYVASHDLQEPLRMVSSYVSLLEEEYDEVFDEEAEQYMEYAVDGATRMQAMIDALLQYSRVQTRGDEFTEVDAAAVVTETIQSLQLLIDEQDATIERGDLPAITGDRSQIGQLFQNLVKNAVVHAGEAPTVEIDGRVDEGEAHFTVADDGPGIDPGQHERIFEIFKQNSARTDSTGIGLAVCKRIVERHGGEIWVESEPDEGATFHFTLSPADEDTQQRDMPYRYGEPP